MSKELAQSMWAKMCEALAEKGGIPRFHRDDVFKVDRRSVGAIWAPNSTYAWLVRENGSHLCRVGVVPKESTEVFCALNAFGEELGSKKHGLWRVDTDGSGYARVREIGVQEAKDLCGRQIYSLAGDVMRRGKDDVCKVELKVSTKPGLGRCGNLAIRSCKGRLSREEVLAAYSWGSVLLARQVDLFARMESATVDGAPLDDVAPVFEIKEVVMEPV